MNNEIFVKLLEKYLIPYIDFDIYWDFDYDWSDPEEKRFFISKEGKIELRIMRFRFSERKGKYYKYLSTRYFLPDFNLSFRMIYGLALKLIKVYKWKNRDSSSLEESVKAMYNEYLEHVKNYIESRKNTLPDELEVIYL